MTALVCSMHGPECPIYRAIREDELVEREAVLAELRKVADDKTRPRTDRLRALEAIESETRGSGAARSTLGLRLPTVVVGNHRGGFFMRTELDYAGAGER